jgi:hypothetical protein
VSRLGIVYLADEASDDALILGLTPRNVRRAVEWLKAHPHGAAWAGGRDITSYLFDWELGLTSALPGRPGATRMEIARVAALLEDTVG